ncbi:MAG: quinone oxidoreductase [Betaproteobacteria bacterium RIFCSPLOWO2_12_FULL_66_14]|nr:MAG: quinone oxidoreductase [Betaproteobacteria bacterium RIFCSPLOWO2_12_FULL_66_14]
MLTKAIRFHQTGGPEVLRWEEIEVRDPEPGEVRLRNTAVGLNYRDIYLRKGMHPIAAFPSGLGIESAGAIEALGPGVTDFAIGQRVACVAGPDNAYAEARLVPAARVVPLPGGIEERSAASMMIRGMTARYLLRETYAVQRGDVILIHAAAGGVGLLVCQWAKHLGATVIGTVGSRAKADVARAHGCDHAIVYTEEDFAERARAITGGAGVAVVYDSVGRTTFEGSLRCLRRRGVLASFGESSGDPEPIAPRRLGQLGSIYVTHPSLPDYTATRAALLENANELFGMVLAGKLKIDINQVYPLSEAAYAHRDMEARRTTGASVLIP